MSKWIYGAGLLAATSAANAQTTVYSNDFTDGALNGFVGGAVTTSPNGQNFLGRFAGSSAPTGTALSLTGLDAHSTVTLSLRVSVIHSWDGSTGPGPDTLRFRADGVDLLNATFANLDGSQQTYSDATPLGNAGQTAARTGMDVENYLGYPTFYYTDASYDLSFTFAHSASTLNLTFDGLNLQDLSDESWGIDNVVVRTDGVVPEPASLAAVGLGVAALLRRRRRN